MYNHPFFVRFSVNQQFDRALREAERGRLLSIIEGRAERRGGGFLARWLPSRRTASGAGSPQYRSRPIPTSKPQQQCC
jgi:hypothetical protein